MVWQEISYWQLSSSAPISAPTLTKTNGARADTKFGFRPTPPNPTHPNPPQTLAKSQINLESSNLAHKPVTGCI